MKPQEQLHKSETTSGKHPLKGEEEQPHETKERLYRKLRLYPTVDEFIDSEGNLLIEHAYGIALKFFHEVKRRETTPTPKSVSQSRLETTMGTTISYFRSPTEYEYLLKPEIMNSVASLSVEDLVKSGKAFEQLVGQSRDELSKRITDDYVAVLHIGAAKILLGTHESFGKEYRYSQDMFGEEREEVYGFVSALTEMQSSFAESTIRVVDAFEGQIEEAKLYTILLEDIESTIEDLLDQPHSKERNNQLLAQVERFSEISTSITSPFHQVLAEPMIALSRTYPSLKTGKLFSNSTQAEEIWHPLNPPHREAELESENSVFTQSLEDIKQFRQALEKTPELFAPLKETLKTDGENIDSILNRQDDETEAEYQHRLQQEANSAWSTIQREARTFVEAHIVEIDSNPDVLLDKISKLCGIEIPLRHANFTPHQRELSKIVGEQAIKTALGEANVEIHQGVSPTRVMSRRVLVQKAGSPFIEEYDFVEGKSKATINTLDKADNAADFGPVNQITEEQNEKLNEILNAVARR